MVEPAGSVWKQHELALIVGDYLSMLQEELAGRRAVKAERRRALQAIVGRSEGSIEYKHQNISAVMELLGFPWIRGYKPARNFQRLLVEVVQASLSRHNLQDSIAGAIPAMPPDLVALEFVSLPAAERPGGLSPEIRELVRNWDPATRDARARALVEAGERYLFNAERNRLSAAGQDRLSEQVRWASREDGDGAGFDILSYSRRGEKRLIEVKTTNGPANTPFWISRNELRVSEERPDQYRVARIYRFAQAPSAYLLRPPLSHHVRLEPSQYRATF